MKQSSTGNLVVRIDDWMDSRSWPDGIFSMGTLPLTSYLTNRDALHVCPEDIEPEDMKFRRLADLEEFARNNPLYAKDVKDHLKWERGEVPVSERARPNRRQNMYNGDRQLERTVVIRSTYSKAKLRKGCSPCWTTEDSFALLAAVTRFEKSSSRVTGAEKWKIVAADLQSIAPPAMTLVEFEKYCMVRYRNMMSRRHTSALCDELKHRLEEFSRLFLSKTKLVS